VKTDRLAPSTGLHVLGRDGTLARLLVDRRAVELRTLSLLGIEVISESALTLEELFVALIKGGGPVRWQPKMEAA
jgi:hypothetical protein